MYKQGTCARWPIRKPLWYQNGELKTGHMAGSPAPMPAYWLCTIRYINTKWRSLDQAVICQWYARYANTVILHSSKYSFIRRRELWTDIIKRETTPLSEAKNMTTWAPLKCQPYRCLESLAWMRKVLPKPQCLASGVNIVAFQPWLERHYNILSVVMQGKVGSREDQKLH